MTTSSLPITLIGYKGKHFTNVKRKGKAVTRKVFLSKDAREALDRYVEEDRGKEPGALFCSKTGNELPRQAVDELLKGIAGQANRTLTHDERIFSSCAQAHVSS